MYRYHCLNAISKVGLERFTDRYEQTDNMQDADAVLVRSAAMHDLELPAGLQAIARAGAGVNNIPRTTASWCSTRLARTRTV